MVMLDPCLIGAGFSAPFLDMPHDMTHRNQNVHGDRTRWREIFYRVDHAPCPGQNVFMTQILTRDLLWYLTFLFKLSYSALYSFLSRDAMRKRGTSCRSVSVCMSNSCIVSAVRQRQHFSARYSPIILVSWGVRCYSIKRETPQRGC